MTIETSGEQVGAHCLVGDPKFADAAADDYTLASDSPAKGAGATYSGIGKDLMGGDFANPPSMGCYEFVTTPPPPSIALGEPAARPGTDYNGSAVTVAFTGEIPAGAVASAALTIGGVGYAGTIDAANGTLSFAVPAGVVTAGNAYEGTVSLTVDGVAYTKGVTLAQGTIKVDVNAAWIHETASAFGETGAWSGDKAVVADGAIAVSNATFTAATTAPRASVVTISSTFRFGVSGAKADRWYALAKTTDLSQPFVLDPATWVSGADLLAGTGELSIALDENEPAAFYRVVESDVAP